MFQYHLVHFLPHTWNLTFSKGVGFFPVGEDIYCLRIILLWGKNEYLNLTFYFLVIKLRDVYVLKIKVLILLRA